MKIMNQNLKTSWRDLQFEDQIGAALERNGTRELKKLEKLAKEKLKENKSNQEKLTFYKEFLTLTSASLVARSMRIHETVEPNQRSSVNNEILKMVGQRVNNFVLTDVDLFKNVQWHQTHHVVDAQAVEGRIYGDGNCGFSAMNVTRDGVVEYLRSKADDADIRNLVAPEIYTWLQTLNGGEEAKKLMQQESVASNKVDAEVSSIFDKLEDETGLRPKIDGVSGYEILLNWENYKHGCEGAEIFKDVSLAKEGLQILRDLVNAHEEIKLKINEYCRSEEGFLDYVEGYYAAGSSNYLILTDPKATGILDVIASWKKVAIRVWVPNDGQEHTVKLYRVVGKPAADTAVLDIIYRINNVHFNKLIPKKSLALNLKRGDQILFEGLKLYDRKKPKIIENSNSEEQQESYWPWCSIL